MAIEPRDARLPQAIDALAPAAGLDIAALDRFLEAQLERVYAFVARRIEDRGAAEEVTTAVFERSVGAARSGSVGQADLGAFALRVAASAVVDHARRARRAIPPGARARDFDTGTDHADAEALSDEAAIRVFSVAIDGNLLRRALVALPEHHQRAVMLVYLDGLPPDEVALLLACSVGEVSLRVNRALRALRGSLDKASIDAA